MSARRTRFNLWVFGGLTALAVVLAVSAADWTDAG